jgi:hypothetical protein
MRRLVPHFASFHHALEFYYGRTVHQVFCKLKLGEFALGVPPLLEGQRAELQDSGIYAIVGDCKERARKAAAPNIGRPYSNRQRWSPTR